MQNSTTCISKEKLLLISATELENLKSELEAYKRISEVTTDGLCVRNCEEQGCRAKVITNGYLEEFVGTTKMFSCDFQIACNLNYSGAAGPSGNYCDVHKCAHLSILKQKNGQVWWICKRCLPVKVNSPDFQQWVSASDNYPRNN